MSTNDPNRSADDLLERAKRLEQRAESPVAAPKEEAPPSTAWKGEGPIPIQEDVGVLGRAVQGLSRGFRWLWKWLVRGVRFLLPLRHAVMWLVRQLRRFALFISCRKDETGVRALSRFSWRRLLLSLVIGVLSYVLVVVLYVFGTRREGVFIINTNDLVDIQSDVRQLGGCMQRSPEQTTCDASEAEIVLIRPSWIPGMGLDPMDYDEAVGQIPFQGQCVIGMYGWYLRGPSLTRGLLKPVAYSVNNCRGVAAIYIEE